MCVCSRFARVRRERRPAVEDRQLPGVHEGSGIQEQQPVHPAGRILLHLLQDRLPGHLQVLQAPGHAVHGEVQLQGHRADAELQVLHTTPQFTTDHGCKC